ncbi:MAG: flagellar hook-length control protein FliK [Fibrobacteria bacterium]|nr:flagellar hook-length control protein FliK [Fibrobacteria bacterium]
MSQTLEFNLLSFAGSKGLETKNPSSFDKGLGSIQSEPVLPKPAKNSKIDFERPQKFEKHLKEAINKSASEKISGPQLKTQSEKIKDSAEAVEEAMAVLEELGLIDKSGNKEDVIADFEKMIKSLNLINESGENNNAGTRDVLQQLLQGIDGLAEKGENIVDTLSKLSSSALDILDKLVQNLTKLAEHLESGDSKNASLQETLGSMLKELGFIKQNVGSEDALKSGNALATNMSELESVKDAFTQHMEQKDNGQADGKERDLSSFGKNANGLEHEVRLDGKLAESLFAQQLDAGMKESLGLSNTSTNVQNISSAFQAAETLYYKTEDYAPQILKQISGGFISTINNGIKEIQVQLEPEHLGKVNISMELKNGEMSGKVYVENEAVKQLLETNLNQLRESIESQNVKIGSLEVAIDNQKESLFEQAQNNRRRLGGLRNGDKDKEGVLDIDAILGNGMGDTGRRLGYNTMELVA